MRYVYIKSHLPRPTDGRFCLRLKWWRASCVKIACRRRLFGSENTDMYIWIKWSVVKWLPEQIRLMQFSSNYYSSSGPGLVQVFQQNASVWRSKVVLRRPAYLHDTLILHLSTRTREVTDWKFGCFLSLTHSCREENSQWQFSLFFFTYHKWSAKFSTGAMS